MFEARRHSVDIPISRTLVALRRSRSLRDPDTNSLDKYAGLVDSMKCDSKSCNNKIIELNCSSRHSFSYSQIQENNIDKRENVGGYSRSNFLCCPSKTKNADISSKKYYSTAKKVHEFCPKCSCISPDPRCGLHSAQHYEDGVDSNSESKLGDDENINQLKQNNSRPDKMRKPWARERVDFLVTHEERSTTSVCEGSANGSSHFAVAHPTDEVNVLFANHNECEIGQCWSRTSKYRDTELPLDMGCAEQPLLVGERRGTACREISKNQENYRTLSLKYRPRFFSELVGQNSVVLSLSNAISIGNVFPLYLFHGPHGTGKTSAARILAAALNCLSSEEHRPCGFCRECTAIYPGKSRDVREIDAAKMNCKGISVILKGVFLAPFSSRFKVIIIDECQHLSRETWSSICDNLHMFPKHTVFVMVTSDIDKLPSSSVSFCQMYHFLKITSSDIVCRLKKISIQEGFDFEEDALHLLANKADGSLRDAEIKLDQLSLLGQKITRSVVYELIGDVSDDELLDLLYLALTSDAVSIVRRAREIMSSKVDPMQLLSQLADLIMDILARCQAGTSESRNIIDRHAFAEVDMHRLRHGLEILSETEKQLRTTKNKSTWLTAALLQFNTGELFCPRDCCNSNEFTRGEHLTDDDLVSRSLMDVNFERLFETCNHDKASYAEKQCERAEVLYQIWRRVIENCTSDSFKTFLLKDGKLSSIHANEGLTIAEIEFYHPEHVLRAEKYREPVVHSLKNVLGRKVDIRFNLAPTSKTPVAEKLPSCLVSHLGIKKETLDSTSALVSKDLPKGHCLKTDSWKERGERCQQVSTQESGRKPSCLSNFLTLRRRFFSCNTACILCPKIEKPNKVVFSSPRRLSCRTCFCMKNPYPACSNQVPK
ncbi:protein STICHEL-like 2 isoform X1 [Typha angustifolia]|uniref:protein STICHEL-like 2 isoform X1 n=1 Tax=Typha angustifolia TaxID=59011 RepID=UPI003C2C45F5